jgi:Skp family chaperone for outer membrane proteins
MITMKKTLLSLLLFSTIGNAGTKQAASQPALVGSAIVAEVNLSHRTGFINSYELMTLSALGAEIQAKAAAMEEKFRQELAKDEENLKKAVSEFQAKAPMMAQAAQIAEKNKLVDLEESYKNKAGRMQQELNAFLQEETTKLSMIIEAEIKTFAEKSGFDVVFDIATGRVVYCEQKLNKTADLIALVNTKTETLAKADAAKPAEKKTA